MQPGTPQREQQKKKRKATGLALGDSGVNTPTVAAVTDNENTAKPFDHLE